MVKKESKLKLEIKEGEENSPLLQRLEEILKRDKPEVYAELKKEQDSKEKPAE